VPAEIDFRSFRTMHASLMRRMGGRLEVARDNMGHVGSTGSITLWQRVKRLTCSPNPGHEQESKNKDRS